MQSWEHCTINTALGRTQLTYYKAVANAHDVQTYPLGGLDVLIANLGQDGWEMVSVLRPSDVGGTDYYFKRPLRAAGEARGE